MAKKKVEEPEEDAPAVPVIKVPTRRRKPVTDLSRALIMMYGPPKIGKTEMANQFPGVWFWATEEGQDWIECYPPLKLTSWEQFLDTCAFVQKKMPKKFGDGKPIKTIVIDTIDLLAKYAQDYMCDQLGIGTLGDLEWSKGWNALFDELTHVFAKVSRWPYGLICISHTKTRQIRSKARKIDRTEPAMGTTANRVLQAMADLILYIDNEESVAYDDDGEPTGAIDQHRYVYCQPQATVVGGGRMKGLPDKIEFGYDALMKAFSKRGKKK